MPTITTRTFYTSQELAKELQLSERTVYNYRIAGTGPKYDLVGGNYIYEKRDVARWIDENRHIAKTKRELKKMQDALAFMERIVSEEL